MKKLIPLALLAGIILILILVFQTFGGRDQNQTKPEPSPPEKITRKANSPLRNSTPYQNLDNDLHQKKVSVKERIQQLVERADNAEMFDETFQTLLAEDPAEIFAYLNTLQFPETDDDQVFNQILFVAKNLDHYFREWSFDEAIVVLDAIYDSPYLYDATIQEIISTSVGVHEGRDTPQYEQIYNWVKANPEVIAAQNAGTAIGGMLYLSDPENGWKKAMELPEGRIRTEAITTIMTQRYVDDIDGASEILNQIGMTPDLDHAVLNLVDNGLEHNDSPAILIDWAVSITEQDVKLHAIERTIHAWQRRDPEELARWIEQAAQEDQQLKPYLELFHKQAINNVFQEEK